MTTVADPIPVTASRESELAVEEIVRLATTAEPALAFTGIEVKPYRRSATFRAVAGFVGPHDRDVVVNLSDDIVSGLAGELPGSWVFNGSITCDHDDKGFQLSIEFETRQAAA